MQTNQNEWNSHKHPVWKAAVSCLKNKKIALSEELWMWSVTFRRNIKIVALMNVAFLLTFQQLGFFTGLPSFHFYARTVNDVVFFCFFLGEYASNIHSSSCVAASAADAAAVGRRTAEPVRKRRRLARRTTTRCSCSSRWSRRRRKLRPADGRACSRGFSTVGRHTRRRRRRPPTERLRHRRGRSRRVPTKRMTSCRRPRRWRRWQHPFGDSLDHLASAAGWPSRRLRFCWLICMTVERQLHETNSR
jgi:hypothetical protein